MNRADTFRHIADQAAKGEINLPSSVNAALRLQAQLDDPDCHLETAIKLVGGEPQLAARVVALANSAAFNRADAEVTGVRAAVTRVGYKSLKTLVASLIVKQLGARIVDAKLRAKADRLWLHTANVAALAHVLARRVTRVDADTAMFAGILHAVGGLYLLARAEEFPGLLDDEPALWSELAEAAVTREVLAKLLVPEAVSQAILAARTGAASNPPTTLADTLVLSRQFALAPSPLGIPERMPEPGDSPLDFVVDSSKLTKLIDESTDELRSMIAALT
jgi:HD-like signal output (HDOD) protein